MTRPILLLLAVAALAAAAPAAEPGPRLVAVLVGVDRYANRPFEDLRFAERDVTRLKGELGRAGYEVTLLLGSAAGDTEATRENVHAVLLDGTSKRFALRDLAQGDTVLVALSGHGEQIPVKRGGAEVETPFFCPKHAATGDPATQVSINAVLDAIDQKKATAFVLIDACRKFTKRVEGKKGAGASMDRAKVNALRPGIGVMFACSDRQEAMEHADADAGDGHGLFFCSLLEAMRDCPRNKRGQVTWGQLVPRVHERVEELADKLDPTTPQGQRQRAQYVGNFSGDPVLLDVAPAAKRPAAETERAGGVPKPVEERAGVGGVPKPGEEREFPITDKVKMRFCWVPAGTATLGSPATEEGGSADDMEEYKFTTSGFWLGKYEVTQGEYVAVMGRNPSSFAATGNDNNQVAGKDTARFPVDSVSWDNTQAFMTTAVKAGRGAGVKFRLPHEDEWEYACRGGHGNKRRFHVGDDLAAPQANFDKTLRRTSSVGSYAETAPHTWGLCDMHGNVWEWCVNLFKSSDTDRVLRGGSWANNASRCRSASRDRDFMEHQTSYNGFRVAADLAGP